MRIVDFKGKKVAIYSCSDCGYVMDKTVTNRPNGKFCDPDCKEYIDNLVLEEKMKEGGA